MGESFVLDKLRELDLPQGRFMVMGSGILDVLGIRQAQDVDLVVGHEVFEELREAGWNERVASNGSTGLERDVFQVYDRWFDEDSVKDLDAMLVDADWVDGVAYNSLARLVLYKMRRGREKDLADLELIRRYQNL